MVELDLFAVSMQLKTRIAVKMKEKVCEYFSYDGIHKLYLAEISLIWRDWNHIGNYIKLIYIHSFAY